MVGQMVWASRSSSGAATTSWRSLGRREPGRQGLGELLGPGVALVVQDPLARLGDREHHAPAVRRVGAGPTSPRASSAASVAPIDCGLICSSLASALEVVGPAAVQPRQRGALRQRELAVRPRWRSRRTSMPMLTRSATATSPTSGSLVIY